MHMACCTFEEHHQPLLFSIAALSLPKYITAFTYETVCSLLTDSNDLVLKVDKADTKILGILTVTDMSDHDSQTFPLSLCDKYHSKYGKI